MNPMLYIPVYSCIGPFKAINSTVDNRFVDNFPPCITDGDGYLISNSVKDLGKMEYKSSIKICSYICVTFECL